MLQVRRKSDLGIYALKIIQGITTPNPAAADLLSHPARLRSFRHPFIVSMHAMWHTETKLYLLMDFIGGSELFYQMSMRKHFSVEQTTFYSAEILLALQYLHENNVVHG